MNFKQNISKIVAACLIIFVVCLAACNRDGQPQSSTEMPTSVTTEAPTSEPTEAPTSESTEAPTSEPTEVPTSEPTEAPTSEPTEAPTSEPTEAPTSEPTEAPTSEPTEKPTEAPCEHTYSNNCDADCNVCGERRDITHDYAEEWITDSSEHWKQCKVCGDKISVAAHVFDNACDGDCNICEEKRIPADHIYGELDFDASAHWKECSECSNVAGSQAHTYEKVYTDTDLHSLSCVACGYVSATETHIFDNDYCTCGYKNPCEHSGGKATCQSRAVCESCGYEYGELGGHSAEIVAGYAATCTKDGLTDGEKCLICNETLKEQQIIPAAHTTEIIPATPPTCEESGLTVGSKCAVCGETLEAQQSVDALGHSYTQTGSTAPKCTEKGSKTYTCGTCNNTQIEYTDALGHTESAWITKPEPTCEAEGYKYKTCLVCEETVDSEKIAALGHSWDSGEVIAPTCTEKGYTKFICQTCTKVDKRDYTNATGHTPAIDQGKDATCTEEGITEGRHCHTCGEILQAQTTINPLGHDEVTHDGKAASCTQSGYEAYVTCSRCDYTTYKEIAAQGHDEVSHDGKAASCTQSGYEAYVTCSRCDYTTYKEIAAQGHDEVPHDGKAASCTQSGYEAYVTCSRCDYTTYKEIAAQGHDEVSHDGKAASCTQSGYEAYVTCSRCDYTTYKEIAALGHNWELQTDNSYMCTTIGGCGGVIEAPKKVGSSFDSIFVGSEEKLLSGYSGGNIGGAAISDVTPSKGTLSVSNMFAGTSLMLWGWVGYDKPIASFGYYFDGNYDAVVSVASISPEDAVVNAGGEYAKRFRIMADTTSLSAGDHTLTYAVCFEDGTVIPLAVWNVSVKAKNTDTQKPTANVIIVSGQSNAYGASPITNPVRAEYGSKTYNNVYIHYNNINVNPNDGVWKSFFSNNGFEQFKLGVGAQGSSCLGPELGIVDYLVTNGYTDDAPLYVIKFTAAGTYLNGQWFPTNLPHYGSNLDPYGLVSDMGDYLYNQMVDYINDSIAMISDSYDVKIQGFFWVQGESDSGAPDLAAQYALYEQKLVGGIRTDFAEYASDTGISFVNYAIAETQEGNIKWAYAETINNCKEFNCGYWYDPEAADDKIITNSMPAISNSYLVIADSLRSKATAGDYEGGKPSTDYAHMCGEDMAILGQWMGEGLMYLKSEGKS